ncbi:hypothetical protein niasHS_005420 [Heterodera schachtii]|uniref:Apple domain-containing protein n=1 Tax=Heterodera schachtii TaxID=97005 RepID=A0ABD2J994_HETSC
MSVHLRILHLICAVTVTTVCALTVPAQHFGAPCHFCECFITYTDRDVNQFTQPYQVLNTTFAYEATEDKCLAHCMNEQQCRLVVYGYVGGREVFACEFYQDATVRSPLYTPYTNIYIKRTSECKKSALGSQALETAEPDERTFKRKMRYLRLYQKFNFFGFG